MNSDGSNFDYVANGYFDLCDPKYFDSTTGIIDAMSLTDVDEYPIDYSLGNRKIIINITPNIDNPIWPTMGVPYC